MPLWRRAYQDPPPPPPPPAVPPVVDVGGLLVGATLFSTTLSNTLDACVGSNLFVGGASTLAGGASVAGRLTTDSLTVGNGGQIVGPLWVSSGEGGLAPALVATGGAFSDLLIVSPLPPGATGPTGQPLTAAPYSGIWANSIVASSNTGFMSQFDGNAPTPATGGLYADSLQVAGTTVTGATLGFLGATPVPRPVLPAIVTLSSVVNALVSLGLLATAAPT